MIDKKIQLQFNSTVNKRVRVRSNCELYSHDKNNNEFELTINNYTLTNEEITVLFKFVKSIKFWETQGKIEDNKIKFKFDTSLITENERVNCYIILKNEEKESDIYSFSFDVKMSEYDLKDNLPVKERYFANSVVVDKLDVLTKEVLAEELEKAKNTFALKTDLSEFVRTSDISDVVRTAALNDYQLKSEMPNVTEIVNNTIDNKGFITTHQSLVDYAKKSELPIDYVSNSKLEELKTQLTIDTSNFATKQSVDDVAAKVTQLENRPVTSSYDDSEIKREIKELKDRPTTANIDTSNFVTNTQLEDKHYLTQHQDISGLATKEQLDELRNNQPTVDTSDLVTKEQLKKAFLDDEEREKYAKKTELPQPYNDTDIKGRLTALENRPAGSVDTNDFVTNRVYQSDKQLFDTQLNRKLDRGDVPFTFAYNGDAPYLYFQKTNQGGQEKAFGTIYCNRDERIIISGFGKYTNLDTALYTLAGSIPDNYTPDFEFGEGDNVKLITNKNIDNYLPANTGNTGNTGNTEKITALDNRLKVLEANTGNTTELDKRLKVLETSPGNTTELDKRLKVLEAKNWEIHGRGMPNGVVTAPVGTTYVDEAVTNGALKWIKKSGSSNVGWDVLIGDTGWKILPSVSKLGGSYVKVRRVNNVVSYQFGGLSWGWFGIVRRGGAGYQIQPSDRERNCFILGLNGIPQGYRSEASLIGGIYNDKGTPYGTWYLGGVGDGNMLRFQFTDPVPTDRDIGDIRVSSISYLTSDVWPTN